MTDCTCDPMWRAMSNSHLGPGPTRHQSTCPLNMRMRGRPSAMMWAIGTFRVHVHFNRHGAAPLVWSIATDAFELAVAEIMITAPLRSMYRPKATPKATPDDEDGRPSAWLEVTGTLTIEGRVARIAP